MKKIFLLFIVHCSLLIVNCFATHNRAGEITYKQISNLTYEVTITTYTYAPSLADRCQLEISWGDGLTDILPRNNGPKGINPNGEYCEHLGVIVGTDIKMNTYTGTHTYPAAGTYIISLEDPTRNGGIVNIPSSVNVPFHIESKLVINPFIGIVNSPVLLNPPIDNACVGRPFIHNPGAYSAYGDSLSYSLQPCKGETGKFIPGYAYPQTSNIFQINPVTGDLLWDSPVLQGEYNVAILIRAWRNGVVVCSIIRDMQILVATCDVNPPDITAFNDTCIVEGTILDSLITAKSNSGNIITLSASGGPFQITNNPATFTSTARKDSVSSRFSWKTNCSHIKKYPWSVIFRAVVKSTPVNLVALKTVQITVVAQPPKNLSANPSGNNIELKWNKSSCGNVAGYKLYRNTVCLHLQVNNCQTGVPPDKGYVLIGQTNSVNDTTFTDTNNGKGLIPGINYGYVVIAYFDDGAESLVSDEACTSLIKNIPVITNISIVKTDNSKGKAYIAWAKPTKLDTSIHSPFRYEVFHSEVIQNSAFSIQHSNYGLIDTTYTDTLLNTFANPYKYRIDLYGTVRGNNTFIGSTKIASSMFLSIKPGDHELILSWYVNVPWMNDKYIIYRQKPGKTQFDSISWTNSRTYTDKGLANGAEYCYYIKSIGKYSDPGFVNPIINLSQQACAQAKDNVSPCAPHLTVKANCTKPENTLTWNNPNHSCSKDVIKYRIWYKPNENQGFELILSTDNYTSNDTVFVHKDLNSIAGCYAVQSVDSVENTGVYSNIVCIDIDTCELYRLPNVFTPNKDSRNNLFIPFPFQYVQSIDIKIFNRWGELVFQSKDSYINWDGKDINSKKDCSEGVYFYVCIVYEERLKGLSGRLLQGTVTIIR